MTAKKAATKAKKTEVAKEETILAYKGFDMDWKCRGMQYKIGETAVHEGVVQACEGGLHSCERPADVFAYYPPGTSRFAVVRASGSISRHGEDSKIASAKLTVEAEIGIPEIISRTVQWVMDRCTPEGETATGYSGAASATGTRGAASATGYSGAASATGDSGAASATGDSGAASATGTRGAASATGYSGAASATGYSGAASATGTRGAASATGTRGAAMASGRYGKAMGAEGCAIFLVYRDDEGKIKHARGGIIGQDGLKPETWYSLDENGEFIEV